MVNGRSGRTKRRRRRWRGRNRNDSLGSEKPLDRQLVFLPYLERPASKDTGAPVGPNSNSRARSKEQAPTRSTVARELPFASVISTFSSVVQTHFASSTTIVSTPLELVQELLSILGSKPNMMTLIADVSVQLLTTTAHARAESEINQAHVARPSTFDISPS